MAEKKIRVAMFTDELDVGKERCPYYRRLIEQLLKEPEIELTLIHAKPNPDQPLYKQTREIILPRIELPFASRFVSFIRFCLTTKEEWDIVHWLHPRVFPFFWLFPAKKKVIMTHAGGDVLSPTDFFSLPRLVFNYTLIWFSRHVDAFLGVSNYGVREIIYAYGVSPDKVFTVLPAVDQMYETLPSDEHIASTVKKYGLEKGKYILFLGRFRLHKHVGHLVRSYIRYREQNPHAKEILALAGSTKAEYDRTFGELPDSPFTSDIKFVGYVETDDVPSIYAGAMVISFVTLSEGFGMPIIEGGACEVPIIVSNATASPEAAGDAAIVVDPHDEQALADAFSLVKKPEVRKTLIERAYKRSRFFTIEMSTRSTIAVYKRVLCLTKHLQYNEKPTPTFVPYETDKLYD
ncbi:glycosyltransferase family 4 protein [Candidatus Kaiserbacteria bacterium]|nr:glycosyltransferase family 4 protein [Candidatus Kaiserbacteria bacterium]